MHTLRLLCISAVLRFSAQAQTPSDHTEVNAEDLAKVQVTSAGSLDKEAARNSESARTVVVRVSPQYPRIAASMKLVGTVQLRAVVRADGTVKEVRVLGGHPVLADAASRAVMQWRYEPAPRETSEAVRISFGQ